MHGTKVHIFFTFAGMIVFFRQLPHYFSLIKFSHTIFAMPFALLGFFLGLKHTESPFSIYTLIPVLLCMVFARSAAMAFNRYTDRKIDAANPRTASQREIPRGIISPRSALWFVWINALLFMGTTFFINSLCFYLSPVALAVILGYSYTKRFTALCHLVLGLGLALAPLGAYLAVTGVFHIQPVLLALLVLCWVSGFDIIYALQDEHFDKENRLHSIPAILGGANALTLSRMLHGACIVLLLYLGWVWHGSYFYWTGAFLFGALLVYQHSLVSPENLSRVNLAFFTSNGIGSIVFAASCLVDWYVFG